MTELSARLQAALGTAYRVEQELGGGGMSRVFVAEETRLGRRVVIKVLPPDLALEMRVDRFNREIRFRRRCNIPTSYLCLRRVAQTICCTTRCRSSRASRCGPG